MDNSGRYKFLYLTIISFILLIFTVFAYTNLTLENPLASQNVTGSIALRCSLNFTGIEDVVNYTFYANNSGTLTLIAFNNTVNESNATATWDSTTIADGTYGIICNATNSTGIEINRTHNSNILVDNNGPTVNSITVNSTFNVTSTELINFTADVNDTFTVHNVTLNGTALTQGAGNNWYTTNTTAQFACTGNVNCTLFITAADSNGLTNSSESITLQVDDFPPSVTSLGTDDSDGNVSSTKTVNFSVTVTDIGMSGVSSVSMNGSSMTESGATYWLSSTAASFSNCPTNGACTFTVTATDTVGNSNSSEELTITVDDTSPTINSFTSDLVNVTSTLSINFTVNTTDTNSVANVSINSTALTQGAGQLWHTANTTAEFGCTGSVTCTFTATTTDNAGNTATTTLDITVDETGPTVSLSLPAAGTTYQNPVNISFTASDTHGISGTGYYLDTHRYSSVTRINTTGHGTTSGSFTTNFTAGFHTIIMWANDTLDNSANSTRINFTVAATTDLTGFADNLSTSIGGTHLSSLNLTFQNDTDATGTQNVNFTFKLALNVNSTGTITPVTIQSFSGVDAVWDTNFSVVSLDTTSSTEIQNNYTTTVVDIVRFNSSLDDFLPGVGYFGTVVIPHNASNSNQITGAFWYQDETNLNSRTSISACTTVGATSDYSSTQTSPCFNVTGASSTTVFLPHFSTITSENDTSSPSVTIAAPTSGANSDSTFQLNITVSLDAINASYFLNSTSSNTSMTCSGVSCTSTPLNFVNGTNYSVNFYSWDSAGNLNNSESVIFYIDDTIGPGISGVANGSVSSSGTTINWTTTEFANASVNYGTTTALGTKTEDTSFDQKSQSITLSSLSAGTLHYYNVTSCDFTGFCNTTGLHNFTTTAASATTTSSSSGGGGGNSGGSALTPTLDPGELDNNADFNAGKQVTVQLSSGKTAKFTLKGSEHKVTVTKVFADRVTLTISSDPFDITLTVGQKRSVDVNGDDVSDLSIQLIRINGGFVDIAFTLLSQPETPPEAAPEQSPEAQPETPEEEKTEEPDQERATLSPFVMLLIIVAIIGIAVIIEYQRKPKKLAKL